VPEGRDQRGNPSVRLLWVRQVGGIHSSVCQMPPLPADKILQQGLSEERLGLPSPLVHCSPAPVIVMGIIFRGGFFSPPPPFLLFHLKVWCGFFTCIFFFAWGFFLFLFFFLIIRAALGYVLSFLSVFFSPRQFRWRDLLSLLYIVFCMGGLVGQDFLLSFIFFPSSPQLLTGGMLHLIGSTFTFVHIVLYVHAWFLLGLLPLFFYFSSLCFFLAALCLIALWLFILSGVGYFCFFYYLILFFFPNTLNREEELLHPTVTPSFFPFFTCLFFCCTTIPYSTVK